MAAPGWSWPWSKTNLKPTTKCSALPGATLLPDQSNVHSSSQASSSASKAWPMNLQDIQLIAGLLHCSTSTTCLLHSPAHRPPGLSPSTEADHQKLSEDQVQLEVHLEDKHHHGPTEMVKTHLLQLCDYGRGLPMQKLHGQGGQVLLEAIDAPLVSEFGCILLQPPTSNGLLLAPSWRLFQIFQQNSKTLPMWKLFQRHWWSTLGWGSP